MTLLRFLRPVILVALLVGSAPFTARATSTPPFRVYLTFEDGPTSEHTPGILDTLAAYHAHATFFINGWQIPGKEAILQRIVREGHAIGNHLWTEPGYYSGAAADKVQAAYRQTEDALRAALGPELAVVYDQQVKLFRQPGGGAQPFPTLEGVRVITYNWNVDSDDCGFQMGTAPKGAQFDKRVIDNVLNKPASKGLLYNVYDYGDGVVVVMHDINRVTGRILPTVLTELQAAGATFEALPRPWDALDSMPVVLGAPPVHGAGIEGVSLVAITTGSTRLRTAPAGKLVRFLEAGVSLTVTGYTPGWYRVADGESIAWISTNRVKVFGPIPTLPIVKP
ncbi:MAG TPA: polysaccharide deacetylase family protein [Anaerolineales bacterium]|nr:polysaccharide deacetylase family protein [Anaerolineales bacterium]HRF46191.1 polysaccharide deacetylase family protein [Anaerolineales bacterium]